MIKLKKSIMTINKMNKNILKLKDVTPIQKLILLYIEQYSIGIKLTMGGCIFTCTDLAKELGTTRRVMLIEFDKLIELGYIISVVADRGRLTNFTDKFKDLIKIKKR